MQNFGVKISGNVVTWMSDTNWEVDMEICGKLVLGVGVGWNWLTVMSSSGL
jgi:hypothetical protein